ncbi:hypothetical protein ACJJTC_015389 [Scirpophaga incertulas]
MLYKEIGRVRGARPPQYVTCIAFNHNGELIRLTSPRGGFFFLKNFFKPPKIFFGFKISWGNKPKPKFGAPKKRGPPKKKGGGPPPGGPLPPGGPFFPPKGPHRPGVFPPLKGGPPLVARALSKGGWGGLSRGPAVLRDGRLLSGGGRDGRLVLLAADGAATGTEAVIEGHYGGVRVIAEGRGGQVYVGTTRNCILHGDLEMGVGLTPAVLGHADEVWGLATHPTLAQFVSAGHDRLLQLWDGLSHCTVWSKDIEESGNCCAWSADGGVIAVGCLSAAGWCSTRTRASCWRSTRTGTSVT